MKQSPDVVFAKVEPVKGGVKEPDDIPVRNGHTLRSARGTRRVDNVGRIIGAKPGIQVLFALAMYDIPVAVDDDGAGDGVIKSSCQRLLSDQNLYR